MWVEFVVGSVASTPYVVEFVVGSLRCSERFFSRYSSIPLSLNNNTFKFQFDLNARDTFQRVLMNSLVLRG